MNNEKSILYLKYYYINILRSNVYVVCSTPGDPQDFYICYHYLKTIIFVVTSYLKLGTSSLNVHGDMVSVSLLRALWVLDLLP